MRKIILLGFCLIHSIAFSQEAQWGPVGTLKIGIHQKIIGETDSEIFLLSRKKQFIKLLRYSKDLTVKNEVELKFDETPEIFVDAFVFNDKIRTIYFNKKSVLIIKDFEYSGSLHLKKELIIPEMFQGVFKNKGSSKLGFLYFKSEDNKTLCIGQKQFLAVIDSNHDIVRTFNFELDMELINVHLSNDNVYYLLGREETVHIYKSDFINTDQKLKLTLPNFKMWDFSLNYSKSDDKLYVASLYGPSKKDKILKGVHVNLINKDELTELTVFNQKFNNETLTAISGKINLKKVKGLQFLKIRNSFFENGRFMFVIEESNTNNKRSPMYDFGPNNSEVNPSLPNDLIYDDFVLMSFTEKDNFQKTIERDYKDTYRYHFKLSSFSTFKNGKLYLAYYQKRSRGYFNHYVFDSSLNQEFYEEVDNYQLNGIYYGVNDGFVANDNSVLFYGWSGSKFGLARIKLDK